MKYKFIVRPEAEADIQKAFNWYEDQRVGLGHTFRHSISSTLKNIPFMPLRFPDVYRGLRRALTYRFPYSIYFLLKPDLIVVVACVHQKRDPEVWRSRLPDDQ